MSTIKPGYMDLHPDQGLNFMMNRLAGTIPPDELVAVGGKIATLDDWVREMLAAAEAAEGEGRLLAAANFYRGAEFYMAPGADRKVEAYERFIALHDAALPEVASQRAAVPYQGGQLPVIDVPAAGAERGVVLAHSGFDGLAEEMYPTLLPLAAAGYRLVIFEGPGQGGALRRFGLHMPNDWEKPVAAILDHYDIKKCTLIGMSLGGYLAPRAAAFEPRVERLVAWGAMYDFFECFKMRLGEDGFENLKRLTELGERSVINGALSQAGEQDATARWATQHGMHVSGAQDPFEFFQWVMKMNLREVSQLIKQDTLIVMGNKDHLVPTQQLYVQAQALVNTRSLTTRMCTELEQGAEHCQVGNPMLVVGEILRWLDGLERRDTALKNTNKRLLREAAA